VDFNKLMARVKAILMTPKTEWPVIAAEPATVPDLYKNYIAILAAIPALGFLIATRSLTGAILQYVLALVVTYVVALVVDALAPTFGGQKNPVQALKAVAYAYTASWVAGIALILPILGGFILLAAGIYGIYLLYLGLPSTMKCPPEKAGGYTAVTIIAVIVLSIVVGIVMTSIFGVGAMTGMMSSQRVGSIATPYDKDSSLGKLDAWSKKMEAAGKQMETAQKTGDADAQGKALGAVMGAALGGGDQVEALGPDMLKPFVPETLGGLKRTAFSAERNGALGMQVSEAHATYSDGANRNLRLEVTDMGTAKGLMAMAGWAALDSSKETDHGYDKTYKQDGRLVHEEWDSQDKRGEFGIVLGERFSVKVSGNADSVNELKAAVASVNLAGLEALKDQGVKKG